MIPKVNCIKCKTELWDENPILQPQKGNHCIFIYCGNVAVFDKNLKLKKAKNIPHNVYVKSLIIKKCISMNISVEEVIKNSLLKEGHIIEH